MSEAESFIESIFESEVDTITIGPLPDPLALYTFLERNRRLEIPEEYLRPISEARVIAGVHHLHGRSTIRRVKISKLEQELKNRVLLPWMFGWLLRQALQEKEGPFDAGEGVYNICWIPQLVTVTVDPASRTVKVERYEEEYLGLFDRVFFHGPPALAL